MNRLYSSFLFLFLFFAAKAQEDSTKITKYMLQDHTDFVDQVLFSPDGKLFVSSGWDEAVMIYETDSVFSYHSHFFPHSSNITALAFSRDSRYLLTGGQDRRVILWEMDTSTHTFQQKSEHLFHQGAVSSLVFGASLRMFYSASDDGTIVAYDLVKKIERKIDHKNPILSIAVSTDQRSIFVSDKSAVITQYDAIKGTVVRQFSGHTDEVNKLVLSLDRKWLTSASSDKTAIIWDLQKGKIHKTLNAHNWKVMSVDVTTNSKYVATGSTDGTVKLWDLMSGSLIRSFDDGGQNVRCVSFNRDAGLIAAGMHAEPIDDYYGAVIWNTGIEKPKPVIQSSRPRNTAGTPNVGGVKNGGQAKSAGTPTSGKNKQVIHKTKELEISVEDKP